MISFYGTFGRSLMACLRFPLEQPHASDSLTKYRPRCHKNERIAGRDSGEFSYGGTKGSWLALPRDLSLGQEGYASTKPETPGFVDLPQSAT